VVLSGHNDPILDTDILVSKHRVGVAWLQQRIGGNTVQISCRRCDAAMIVHMAVTLVSVPSHFLIPRSQDEF